MTETREAYARLMVHSIDATLSRLVVQIREADTDESPWITVSEHYSLAYAEKMTASLNNFYAARAVAELLLGKKLALEALREMSKLL